MSNAANFSNSILVLDSGVGGITVMNEIRNQCPRLACHYLADVGFYPYGNKTEQQLEQRLLDLITRLNHRHSFSLIVIACNSASTAVLDFLRQRIKIPFVGVVPAIKPAASLSKNKRIAILATEGTIKRDYTQKLINEFASDCEVLKVASPELVDLAERYLQQKPVADAMLIKIVQPILDFNADVCVLGCTHFPWFSERFLAIDPTIQWIDSAQAIARRVQQVLENEVNHQVEQKPVFYFTHKDHGLVFDNPKFKQLTSLESYTMECIEAF